MVKRWIRGAVRKAGYEIVRRSRIGNDPIADMQLLLGESVRVVIDVGGNIGQTVERFRDAFPLATVHSFEPSPSNFAKLTEKFAGDARVRAWNCAVGSATGNIVLNENSWPDMSSVLSLDRYGWGEVREQVQVRLTSIDAFMSSDGIERIDVLKSDTQGYELEVLRGAENALSSGMVGLVYIELILSEMYKDLPPFDEIVRFLRDRRYKVVSLYDLHHQGDILGWMDALFVHETLL